jgi:hypothetical protein
MSRLTSGSVAASSRVISSCLVMARILLPSQLHPFRTSSYILSEHKKHQHKEAIARRGAGEILAELAHTYCELQHSEQPDARLRQSVSVVNLAKITNFLANETMLQGDLSGQYCWLDKLASNKRSLAGRGGKLWQFG